MNSEDLLRFQHMYEYALITRTLVEDETRDNLIIDLKLRLALIRAVEVIGEAASRISPDTQAAYPDIPWAAITGMRNRLIHGYFNINLDILWVTATVEVPNLVNELEKIIPQDEG